MASNLLDRRRFLVATGSAAVVLASMRDAVASAAELDPSPFTLGVASGDPTHDSVVLWTRLAPDPLSGGGMPDVPVRVGWEVAGDATFVEVVRRGEVTAHPGAVHSVHAVAAGLAPDRWYHYRFQADGVFSRVGRTRTLPAPSAMPERLRFAFASCQGWKGGPYPAYRAMAERDLDFVLHLGDYIYETQDGSLAEFRRLHSLYKTSPDLREAHARFPFITIWDDHEVLQNWAGDHKPNPDGRAFPERRTDALKAYYEHLPMRTAPDGPDYPAYRRFRWGRLAELSVLDTRQYRDAQACGDGRKAPCDEVFDEDRTMTGPEQERWLLDGLRASRTRWNVIAQQTILASFDYDLGPGRSYNLDQWDGYPAARRRILDAIAKDRPSNPIVLSGDWHSHWVNDILADFDDPSSEVLASEFVGTSLSSGIGWDAAVRQGLPVNPHVKLYNGDYRGYVECEVTPRRWESTLRIVLDPADATSPAYTLAAFEVRDGVAGARRLDKGDGMAGTVSDTGGSPLPNAEVLIRQANGSVVVRAWTGADGAYVTFVPPGDYTIGAHAVGFESTARPVTVREDDGGRENFALAPVSGAFAGTGRRVPGPKTEGGAADIVLGNEAFAMTVSQDHDDPQLPRATRGKPIDLAARGRLDQIDWCNLPYVAAGAPTGTEAWQRGLVRATAVEVVESGPSRAVVRTGGAATDLPAIIVETTFTVAPEQPWALAESVFTNAGATAATVWIGDAIDHDGAGQRSGVAGHGTISTPYGSPGAYVPTGRWIGMTGGDAQTYAIVYEDNDFTGYGNGNWIQSQRKVDIAPRQSWTLRRRIVAVPHSGDAWAVIEGI